MQISLAILLKSVGPSGLDALYQTMPSHLGGRGALDVVGHIPDDKHHAVVVEGIDAGGKGDGATGV